MKKLVYFCLCASLFFTCFINSVEATTYEYDELGRVTQVTNEDGSRVTYIYDVNGNLIEIKTEVGEAQTETPGSGAGINGSIQDGVGTTDNAIGADAIVVSESAEHATNADGVSDNTAKDPAAKDDIAEDNTTGTDTTDEDIIADIEAKLEGQSNDENDGFGILGGIVTGATVVVAGGAFFWLFIKKKKKDDAKEEEES